MILTSGAASVSLAAAAWRRGRDARARLSVDGARFSGRLAAAPTASGTWLLELATADGTPLEGDVPELRLRVVPDSATVVSVPVPGRDTTLPLTLRQPLVIDARDDHGLTRLEVVSWRVSRTGKVGAVVRESLAVADAGSRTATLSRRGGDAPRRGRAGRTSSFPGDGARAGRGAGAGGAAAAHTGAIARRGGDHARGSGRRDGRHGVSGTAARSSGD